MVEYTKREPHWVAYRNAEDDLIQVYVNDMGVVAVTEELFAMWMKRLGYSEVNASFQSERS